MLLPENEFIDQKQLFVVSKICSMEIGMRMWHKSFCWSETFYWWVRGSSQLSKNITSVQTLRFVIILSPALEEYNKKVLI